MASRNEIVCCIAFWGFILACNIESGFGDLLLIPSQAEVVQGDSITIPCATTYRSQYYVQWQHTPVGSNGAIDIFFAGFLIRKFQGKYEVKKDADMGEYNLTILSAVANDAGTYTCIDKRGSGEQRRTALIVLDSQPVGQSNVSLDQLTICGDEADYIVLSCHVSYAGDEDPRIEWKQIFNNGTDVSLLGQVNPEVRHESVSYHLAMRIDPSMDGSVLRCISTIGKSSWTSDELNIHYALNKTSVTSSDDATTLSCKADSNQLCTYKWTGKDDDVESIYSDNEMINFSNLESGTYMCTAECNVGNKQCTVHPQIVEYTNNNSDKKTVISVFIITGVGSVVFISILVLAVILVRHRKSKDPREKKEERIHLLSEENLTPSSNLDKLIVRGIAELKKKIYVIFQEKTFIRVISDLDSFKKERDICLNLMVEPWDLEPCAENLCLYVADRDPNNCIWKVNIRNDSVEKWPVDLRKPHKLSVISRGRVAIPKWQSSIEIRASDGSLEQTIDLPQNMLEPYSVLQTRDENFIVAHGHQKSLRQRVCELRKQNSEWQIRWSYPEDGGDTINNIDSLAMDNSGRIFVSDQNNLRIILLDDRGMKLTEIRTEEYPYRLCYAKDNERLLVGHRGAIASYKVDAKHDELKIHLLKKFVHKRFSYDSAETKQLVPNRKIRWSRSVTIQHEIGEHVVSGITELNNKFYVVLQDQPLIHVFKVRDTFEKIATIPVEELSDPWFIDACPINNCLYVTDRRRGCVLKVSRLDENVETVIWKPTIGEPHKLAVISKGRVLIPLWPATLEIYDSEGKLDDSVSLPQDLQEPYHAVEAEYGSYILGHGDKKSGLHRVCKVKWSRKKGCHVVWKFGDQRGNKEFQLNRPRNIAIGKNGQVFITDEGNKRLVLLDKNGVMKSTEKTTVTPERLFYSKSAGCLLVGHYGSISQYYVDEKSRFQCGPWTSGRCLGSATDA